MKIMVDDREILIDKDGFLENREQWSPNVARMLAKQHNIILRAEHWKIIEAVQEFYRVYEMSPNQRPFVRYVNDTLGSEMGNSRYLMKLFSGSPAKMASLIAGLPKPSHCF